MEIIIDTKGQPELASRDEWSGSDDDPLVPEDTALDPKKLSANKDESTRNKKFAGRKGRNVSIPDEACIKQTSKMDIDLDEFEREMGWGKKRSKRPKEIAIAANAEKIVDPVEKILKKSAIQPGFEQRETVPRYDESQKRLRIMRRKEREKTKGKKWFNLPATQMTAEIRRDLQIIQMRSVLDPKHFYKKNDSKTLPKYFHIGKVVDSPIDYYNSRLTKKERKRTIVDELLADAEFTKFNKKKYKEILEERSKTHFKAHKHARKLKGKKK